MAIPLTINGVGFNFPQTGDSLWGDAVTAWATAVTSGMLQKAGGNFTLTADVNFGNSFGLFAKYFGFRNAANSAFLKLALNANDALTFNGNPLSSRDALSVIDFGAKGDGTTDDSAAILAALTAGAASGQAVFFPGATYIVASQITVPSNSYLYGIYGASIIKYTGTTSSSSAFYQTNSSNIIYRDLVLQSTNTNATASITGITFDLATAGCFHCKVDRCKFTGPSDGVGFNIHVNILTGVDIQVNNSFFERVVGTASGNGYGILISNNSLSVKANFNTIDFIHSSAQGGRHGIYFSSGTSFSEAIGNYIKNTSYEGISLNSLSATQNQVTNIVIQSNILNTCGNSGITDGAILGSGFLQNISISDNSILNARSCGIVLQCEQSANYGTPQYCNIDGNNLFNCQQDGIVLLGAYSCKVVSNFITNVSLATGSTYNGITISDNSEVGNNVNAGASNFVDNNTIAQPSATLLRSGIRIISSAAGNIIGSNNAFLNTNHFNSTTVENSATSTTYSNYGQFLNTRTVATTSSLGITDDTIKCNAASAGFTLTIPSAVVGYTGKICTIIKTDSTLNVVTLGTGLSTTLNTQGESIEIQCDGSTWQILRRNIPSVWTTAVNTIHAVTTNPTKGTSPTADLMNWRRVGNCMELIVEYAADGVHSGTAGSGTYLWPIPASQTLDTAIYAGGTGQRYQIMGPAAINNAGANLMGFVIAYNSGNLAIYQQNTIGNNQLVNDSNSPLSDNNVAYAFRCIVPISGWNNA